MKNLEYQHQQYRQSFFVSLLLSLIIWGIVRVLVEIL